MPQEIHQNSIDNVIEFLHFWTAHPPHKVFDNMNEITTET